MKTYIEKPKVINISQVKEKNSFSINDFLKIKNWNSEILKKFLEKSFINSNIDSCYYYKNSKYFLVTNKALNDNILSEEEKYIWVIPEWFKTKNKCVIQKWDLIIWNNWTLWQIAFIKKDFYWITNSNVTLLRFNNLKSIYYLIWIFHSKWFRENCFTISTKSWTQQFITRDNLENTKIPFPSKNNHREPEKIENLVSLITQNLIDKEEQIKLKNKIIDEKIEKELKENQTSWKYEYCFPTISWIRETSRLDTWLYWQKFKEFYSLVENYKYWYWNIEELWFKTKKWPNLAISVIWTSIYSDEKINKNFKQLILSKDVTEEWWIKKIKYIWNKKNLPTLKQYDFMLFARWDIGRVLFIDDSLVWATSNFDVFFITSKLPYFKNIFLLNYFKFLKTHNFWEYFWVWGSWAPSLTDYFLKKLKIPNFPDEKQQEIASLYYNKVEKNIDLTFENYLEKEKKRNSELWIFQLNMELFELRETLENLIDKIIMNEEINVDFWY